MKKNAISSALLLAPFCIILVMGASASLSRVNQYCEELLFDEPTCEYYASFDFFIGPFGYGKDICEKYADCYNDQGVIDIIGDMVEIARLEKRAKECRDACNFSAGDYFECTKPCSDISKEVSDLSRRTVESDGLDGSTSYWGFKGPCVYGLIATECCEESHALLSGCDSWLPDDYIQPINTTLKPADLCGDGKCSGWEDSYNCPEDCSPICGNGVCEPLMENCMSCADCICPPGTSCLSDMPEDISPSRADFRGCVALSPLIEELKNEYRENLEEISKLSEGRLILQRFFRHNWAKRLAKFMLFDASITTNPLDLLSTAAKSIIRKHFENPQEMSDEEILGAQIRAIQDIDKEIGKLYDRNKEIKERFKELTS